MLSLGILSALALAMAALPAPHEDQRDLAWLYQGPCVAVLEYPNYSNPPFVGYSGRLVYAQPRDCLATTASEEHT
jgi:hypothetical protein